MSANRTRQCNTHAKRTHAKRTHAKRTHAKRRTRFVQRGGQRNIELGYKDEYNLKRLHKRHDHSIYQMTSIVNEAKCLQVFSVDRGIHYLVLGLANGSLEPIHFKIINLNKDEDHVPPEVVQNIEASLTTHATRTYSDLVADLEQQDVRVIKQMCHEEQYPKRELDRAKRVLDEFNKALRTACPNNDLYLTLDYAYNLPGLVHTYLHWHTFNDIDFLILCLYHNDTCVSSIELMKDEGRMDINSKTLEMYEGYKYNTLLRGVAILVAAALGCTHFDSTAINPTSAYVLLKYYKAQPLTKTFADYLSTQPNLTYATIADFKNVHKRFDVNLTIELTPQNVQHTRRVVQKLIQDVDDEGISCP